MLQINSNGAQEITFLNKFQKGIAKAQQKTVNETAFGVRADLQASMKKDFDRPTPFTLRGVAVQKAAGASQSATVKILPIQAQYLGLNVSGGIRRPHREWIVVPDKNARRNRYGNLTKAAKSKLFSDPKNFVVEINPTTAIVFRRQGSKPKKIAVLTKSSRYLKRWPFYTHAQNSALKLYPVMLKIQLDKLERLSARI